MATRIRLCTECRRNRFGTVISIALLLLSGFGCSGGSAVDTAAAVAKAELEGGRDVAAARVEASFRVTAAHLKAARTLREGASEAAAATRYVAIATARATYKIATARCQALDDTVRNACRRQADEDFAEAKARADALRATNDPVA